MRSLNRLKFKFLVETSVRRIVDEEVEIMQRQTIKCGLRAFWQCMGLKVQGSLEGAIEKQIMEQILALLFV